MRTSHIRLVALSALFLAACNPFRREPVTEVTRDVNVNSRWRAALVTPATLIGAVQMKGTATMEPGRNTGDTDFSLSIDNATPGGVHPWQVHRGQCGMDEGVLGSSGAYKAVKIGDDGRGKSTARIEMVTPSSGNFFVTVQASEANQGTIVACGNLAPPAQ